MNDSTSAAAGVAIIGMAGHFPKAGNIEELWKNLSGGVDCITHFSEQELEASGIDFPKGNSKYVKARGILEGADMFDAAFFGINPKEAEIIDPQQRVFLECAWEALENAGYDPAREERPIGVFAGMSMNTYLLENLGTHPELMELVGHHPLMLANDKDFLPTRVSYKLNLKGPSLSIQTACSTSLVAVVVACQHLLNYQCDFALAGGVSITFPQKKGYYYQEGGIVSPDGRCRAFDAKAQGTVAGEGVGLVVLKRLADAVEDGDQIFAVIRGFAINNDGSNKVGFTAPSVDGQAEVIALAQAVAGVSPETIGYLVAHGTGTPLGDPIEVAGLTKAFRAGTNAKNFCALGSTKTNIGHLDAAAGVAGLINAVLALHHKKIPPSLHFDTPNPKIDFADSPFFVNTRLADWGPSNTPRRAGVSSFGIGGTNAHVVLEEAPAPPASDSSRPAQLLVVSARTPEALDQATANLLTHLRDAPATSLPDLAYTLQVGRHVFPNRRMLVCESSADAIRLIEKRDASHVRTQAAQNTNGPSVVFMFPGQGSQYTDMARELYENEPVFREQVDRCAEFLRHPLRCDIREVLYPVPDRLDAAREQLSQTSFTQPAIFVTSYALAKLWIHWGIQPEAMIGHSVGEYVAACLAEVFSLPEALELVATRGKLVQALPAGAMLAVRFSEDEARQLLSPELSLASVNAPNLSIISGPKDAITALQESLRSRGIASNLLQTSHAFHSAMMDPVVPTLTNLVRKMQLKNPRIPYVSTVTADWATSEQAADPAYWGRHLRETVRFAPAVSEFLKNPDRILLEVGPGQILTNLVRQHPGRPPQQTVLPSLRHAQSAQKDYSVLVTALGQLWMSGVPVNWGQFYSNERRQRTSAPTYPFERQKYWVEPLRREHSQFLLPATLPSASAPLRMAGVPNRIATALPNRQGQLAVNTLLPKLFGLLSGLDPAQLDAEKTFLDLGLDSLFLTQASQAIEKVFGVPIAFSQLLDNYPTLNSLAAHLSTLVPLNDEALQKVELRLNALAGGAKLVSDPDAQSPVAPGSEPAVAPLTEGQREIWFSSQVSPEASRAFNLSLSITMEGNLNIGALLQALQTLADRHDALRTVFPDDGKSQKSQPGVTLNIPLFDWSELSEDQQHSRLTELINEQVTQAFDLVRGPLLRAQLVKMGAQSHRLIFTLHHLVCDGTSLATLQTELSELYSANVECRAPNLSPPVRYSDYARHQTMVQDQSQGAKDESFWLTTFATPAPKLNLPLDFPRVPKKNTSQGWATTICVDQSLYHELKKFSAANHSTLFTTLLSAYYILLHALSGEQDLVVGVPVALRDNEEQERLIGSCVNFLPLRVGLARTTSFTDFLLHVRQAFFDLYDHRNFSFGRLVEKLSARDRGRSLAISATFNFQRQTKPFSLDGLNTQTALNPTASILFDLTLNVTEKAGDLLVEGAYRSDLFSETTIRDWLSLFHDLLGEVVCHPEKPIDQLASILQSQPFASGKTVGGNSLEPIKVGEPGSADISIQEPLTKIWQEVIGLKEVKPDDNFFDLGGHSVLVIQILSRVRNTFGVELTLRAFFEAPTVRQLTELIGELLQEQLNSISDEEARRLTHDLVNNA